MWWRWGTIELHAADRCDSPSWLRPRVLVETTTSGEAGVPLATFAQRGGVLGLSDGRAYNWTKPERLTSERIWIDSAGAELVRFHPARQATVAVTTPPETAQQAELPLLILLGQYLIVLAAQDAEAAVAATTAAIIASTYPAHGASASPRGGRAWCCSRAAACRSRESAAFATLRLTHRPLVETRENKGDTHATNHSRSRRRAIGTVLRGRSASWICCTLTSTSPSGLTSAAPGVLGIVAFPVVATGFVYLGIRAGSTTGLMRAGIAKCV